jgi:CheY-like chemotaxis protein
VVLSAKAIPGEREKALSADANEYLQKPVVDVDRLLKIARDLLAPDATSERPQACAAEGEPDASDHDVNPPSQPAVAKPAHVPAEQDAAGPSEPAASQPTRTVLYIEDNPAITTLIARLLTNRPHIRLISAATARQGIDTAAAISPDLILLDNRLPDGTGTSVRDQLAATPATATIPVIIISGDANSPDIPLAANVLPKPFSIKQFLTTIDQHLP